MSEYRLTDGNASETYTDWADVCEAAEGWYDYLLDREGVTDEMVAAVRSEDYSDVPEGDIEQLEAKIADVESRMEAAGIITYNCLEIEKKQWTLKYEPDEVGVSDEREEVSGAWYLVYESWVDRNGWMTHRSNGKQLFCSGFCSGRAAEAEQYGHGAPQGVDRETWIDVLTRAAEAGARGESGEIVFA